MAGNIKESRRIPFSYQSGATLLHRAPAGLKLLALLILSITTFSSIPGLLLSAMLTCAASLAARIRPWKLLRGFRSLFILSLFILIFTTVDPGAEGVSLGEINVFGPGLPAVKIPFISAKGFFEGVLSGLRITVSFAAGSLLFAVTTMRELRLSLGKAERAVSGLLNPVRNRSPRGQAKTSQPAKSPPPAAGRISLSIGIMLGFIPRFFELWETMNMACEARSCKRGLRRFMLIIPLIIERMLEMAADTADALEAKGISYGKE
ncbi:MAG: energy-coupling factor transporter transmembrane protein EcfT [Treponema sp.]|jgi:biotin transport system permease protein|nr:energy-coupling factor transporter transmembrane protein EcfT [Treponema sp.]